MLQIIGERLAPERVFAPAIQKDIALRWADIIKTGLPKEEKLQLANKYPTPENFTVGDPPKLNPEVKASLNETIVKRDGRIIFTQERIACCISALGKAASKILSKHPFDLEDHDILEQICDVGRLLADLQHEESHIRKNLILQNINASIRETLNSTVIEEFLFGKSLEDHIKTAKSIERSSKDLKATPKKLPNQTKPKNSKGPLFRQSQPQTHQKARGGGQGRFYQTDSGNRKNDKRQEYQSRPVKKRY